MMDGDGDCTALLDYLRQQCLQKGLGGVKGLAVFFRRMDTDFNKALCWNEFKGGITQYGLQISESDLQKLFRHFDSDGSGHIDFREFIHRLQPPMSPQRVKVVDEAFDKMDVVKDGVLDLEDLKIAYKQNAMRHPKYRNGTWTLENVMQDFLNGFDSKDSPDGVVTREEFVQYYAAVSATIDDDAYFDMCMRSAWGLPARRPAAQSHITK